MRVASHVWNMGLAITIEYSAETNVKRFEPPLMRILVVEDDKTLAGFVTKGLKQAGYAVDLAQDGQDGLHMGLDNTYDAAVVDIMLPELDGLSLIERWRGKKIKTPVIILSAKRTVDDRIKGLQSGGDDYLTKPFSFSELLARVQALIRRSTQTADPTTLSLGDLTLNLLTREVTREAGSWIYNRASSRCSSTCCATAVASSPRQ